ncbi:MAG: hypothetical protein NTX36_02210 [Proteobacteria bacterium]|nr:hypothetical protein [Pseudomonadota bacterium]
MAKGKMGYYKSGQVLVEAGSIKIVDAQNFKPKNAVRKVSGYPGANRREARKLGLLLLSKSSEAERERLKPPERNERVCEGCSDTHDDSNDKSGLKGLFGGVKYENPSL